MKLFHIKVQIGEPCAICLGTELENTADDFGSWVMNILIANISLN